MTGHGGLRIERDIHFTRTSFFHAYAEETRLHQRTVS
ncbi:hypothetical protein [Bradyrhizobium sp. STM 3561]